MGTMNFMHITIHFGLPNQHNGKLTEIMRISFARRSKVQFASVLGQCQVNAGKSILESTCALTCAGQHDVLKA